MEAGPGHLSWTWVTQKFGLSKAPLVRSETFESGFAARLEVMLG